MPLHDVQIRQVLPTSDTGRRALWHYFHDVVSRYYGRPAGMDGVRAACTADPNDDLAPPRGLFLVATEGAEVVGCTGLRLLDDEVGEIKRMFVFPQARGLGLARRLLREIELAAAALDITRLVLDTRSDLVEARQLYASHGYEEVTAFNDNPYADHWFAKSIKTCGRAGEQS